MRLAKPFFDIGLTVRDPVTVGAFWRDEIGAVFDHLLPITETHEQHRFDLNGSVLKLNRYTDPSMPTASVAGGYREVLVAVPGLNDARALVDPEGNRVRLVPEGYMDIGQVGMRVGAHDLSGHRRFFTQALGLQETGPGQFPVGRGMLILEQGDGMPEGGALEDPGYRYLTFQIFDVRKEHALFLDAGGHEGWPIQQLRDVARFSMVRDPDGNWIELSQRASLTGPLD